jgi:hypothetical protein
MDRGCAAHLPKASTQGPLTTACCMWVRLLAVMILLSLAVFRPLTFPAHLVLNRGGHRSSDDLLRPSASIAAKRTR